MSDLDGTHNLSRRGFLQGSALFGLSAAVSVGAGTLASPARADTPVRGGDLRLGLDGGATADTLDPALASASVAFVVACSWGDTLVESDPKTGEALPSLAESWSPSADAKMWTFKIRKGVTFHDGTPLKASDAAATLRRHAGKGSQSGALGLLSGIEKIEERGDDMVITLSEGNADLPLVLTDYHLQIQPGGGVKNPNAAIGTGPYKLVTFQPGLRVVLEKNKHDWRQDRGHVDSVHITVMNDLTARISALQSGQVDFINTIDPKVVALLKRLPSVEILRTSGKGFYSFLMHCDTPPFDNNDLRMALKLAIDREAILKQVVGGYGTLGNDYPVNSNYALAPTDIPQRAYDPEKAASYYKKSGHDGPILLRTSDAAFPGAVEAAQLFQQSAAKAGIKIDVKREPSDGYWTEVWNVKPFCASYWGGRPTQDARYSTSYVSDAKWNDTRFKHPEFDKMAAEARAELNPDKRRKLYRQMALMVRDEGGLILPVFNDYLNASSKHMKGYVNDIGNDLSNGRICSRVWLQA
ncbi:MAG TPA: ABC transporter substrate-binding protein [Rhizobiaceae bacterium]|nr:ABC transporter substrate-binding protein [Rhizobiaceae bacterium]